MDEQALRNKLVEFINKKVNLSDNNQRRCTEQLAEETQEQLNRIQNLVAELQESLDDLSLNIKYLVFDLEATQRENAYLRRLLEQANQQPNQDEDEGE